MSKSQSKHLRSLIIQYFQCISSGQNIIQCITQTLFLHPNFNPLLLFDIISTGQQLLTRKHWYNYLISINIQFEQQELLYLFHHHKFNDKTKFNQFLQALLPYNTDVLRIFRKSYIEQIQNMYVDQQVLCIFGELVKFWIQLFRNLIKIKKQISSVVANQLQIVQFVKQDLIYQNKNRNNVRQAMKYKQKFQQNQQQQLTFAQLRRFLQLWTIQEQRNLQFQLLQIKRYLKHDYPFRNICLKSNQIKNSPLKRKSNSANKIKRNKQQHQFHTNIKYKQPKQQEFLSQNRYQNFKSELFRQLIDRKGQTKFQPSARNQYKTYQYSGQSGGMKSDKKTDKKLTLKKLQFEQQKNRQEYLRDLRYARDKTCLNGTYITKIFQQISTKQQNLQKLRKKLVNSHDFNLINLFKLIDHKNIGYITQYSIQQYLNLKQDLSFKQLIQFHARQKQKQILRFQDFCMIFRPLSKKLNQILDQKLENKLPNPFKKDTIKTISTILILTAQLFNNLYQFRCRINNQGIKIINLFRFVDIKNKGYIEDKDIKDLLDQKNISCDDKNLKCIMKIFKKRVNQKIYLKELEQFLDL